MPKVIALMNFRGASWSEEFKEGNIYDLEGARVQSLALRGLVKPFAEDAQVAEAPKAEEPKAEVSETPKVETAASEETTETPKAEEPVQTTKRIGRPRRTE